MNCPYCDSEMIHGYLNCGNMIWSERKHKIKYASRWEREVCVTFRNTNVITTSD